VTTTDGFAPTAVLHRRVLLADGQGLVRAGFRLLLEATGRISVVGEAASGEEAVASALRLRPDVALIDATIPGLDSVQATRQISSQSRVAVILLIASQDDEHSLAALRAEVVRDLVEL
jgi:DNA-binding NarL/FixJ family response regulator